MVFNRKSDGRPVDPSPVVTPPANRATPPPPPPKPSMGMSVGAESVIGSDLTIEGQHITIRCRGALRVNGTLQADVHSMQIVIGEEASIHGVVAADTVNVFGRVNGAILGARVVLHPSAMVEGDVHSQTLSIEQGASFDGRSRKVVDLREIAPQIEPGGQSSQAHSQESPSQHDGQQVAAGFGSPRLHS